MPARRGRPRRPRTAESFTGSIGVRIDVRAAELGLTDSAIARAVGVSQPAVSKWRSGSQVPDVVHWPAIAEVLQWSVSDLIPPEFNHDARD